MSKQTVSLIDTDTGLWHTIDCMHAGSEADIVVHPDNLAVVEVEVEGYRISIDGVVYLSPCCSQCAEQIADGYTTSGSQSESSTVGWNKRASKLIENKLEPAILKSDEIEYEIESIVSERRPVIVVEEHSKFATIRVSTQPTGYQLSNGQIDMIKSAFDEFLFKTAGKTENQNYFELELQPGDTIQHDSVLSLPYQDAVFEKVLLEDVSDLVAELESCIAKGVDFCYYQSLPADDKITPAKKIPIEHCTTLVDGEGIIKKPPQDAFTSYDGVIEEYIQRTNQIRLARHIEHKTDIRETDETNKIIQAYNTYTRTKSAVQFENGAPVDHTCDCVKGDDVTCEHVVSLLRNLPDTSGVFCGEPESSLDVVVDKR